MYYYSLLPWILIYVECLVSSIFSLIHCIDSCTVYGWEREEIVIAREPRKFQIEFFVSLGYSWYALFSLHASTSAIRPLPRYVIIFWLKMVNAIEVYIHCAKRN